MNKADFFNNIKARLGRNHEHLAIADYPKGAPEYYTQLSGSKDELLKEFTENLEAVHGKVYQAQTAEDVQSIVAEIIQIHQATSVIRWDDPALDQMQLDHSIRAAQANVHIWDAAAAKQTNIDVAKHADIGITTADYAIANTGTSVLTYSEKKGRAVSLLPPVHVLVLKQEQLVARMGDIFHDLREKEFSTLHFLTGPSKSADIELQLTTGVHGPKHVYAIMQID
ncbi:L-lactate dehydrogenase complex protein LldG [Bacillus ectoiniformans]|uniref:LutC/YkgG family protein n=1 Tax=Bacillus ectoiniformans TaxID=1494429 RepID=UPI0019574693|nr:lactate utilization protein C [Bacillus ectoiniformans]MBM7649602.1 L-lactate dehydrogenase complex protein LldG [Bacillus ectoiniformans]